MEYRKKPIVVTASQWFKDGDHPEVFVIKTGDAYIGTLEGPMHVTPGDYIIQGIKGEHYACKPDVFHLTYEPLTETKTDNLTVPDLSSNTVNEACWAFVEAMPHQLPSIIWNELKPAVYAAIKSYHQSMVKSFLKE